LYEAQRALGKRRKKGEKEERENAKFAWGPLFLSAALKAGDETQLDEKS